MDESLRIALRTEAFRVEEDALYSARAHFEAASQWDHIHYRMGVPTTVLAAVAGGSAIAEYTVIAAVVGICVTVLSALSVFLNPSERSAQHHNAGTRFNEVRNLARVFREIDAQTAVGEASLVDRLKALGAQRDELNKASPQIPRWAFERARRGIEAGEASHAVDTTSNQSQLGE